MRAKGPHTKYGQIWAKHAQGRLDVSFCLLRMRALDGAMKHQKAPQLHAALICVCSQQVPSILSRHACQWPVGSRTSCFWGRGITFKCVPPLFGGLRVFAFKCVPHLSHLSYLRLCVDFLALL